MFFFSIIYLKLLSCQMIRLFNAFWCCRIITISKNNNNTSKNDCIAYIFLIMNLNAQMQMGGPGGFENSNYHPQMSVCIYILGSFRLENDLQSQKVFNFVLLYFSFPIACFMHFQITAFAMMIIIPTWLLQWLCSWASF